MLRETLILLFGAGVYSLATSLVMALVLRIAAPWVIGRSVSYPRAYLVALIIEWCALGSLILVSLAFGRPQSPMSNMAYGWYGQAVAYWLFGWLLPTRFLRSTGGELPESGRAARLSLVLTAAFVAMNLVRFWIVRTWFLPEMP